MEKSARTGRIFMKFGILVFFKNLSEKFKFYEYRTRVTGTLHEDQYTFMIISRSVPLRIRNVAHKPCRENQNTRFRFSTFFFETLTVYEITRKYMVEPERHR